MRQIEINLLKLESYQNEAEQKKKSSPLPRIFFIFISLFVVLLTGTSAFSYQQSKNDDSTLSRAFDALFGAPIATFSNSADRKLSGHQRDRINILLLGIGGKGHEGAYLSDTIIIASIKPSTKQVALISIPRDLLVYMDGYGWRKINNADAFGEAAQPGYGPRFASTVASNAFDIPIDYYARMDFEGFAKIVDIVGGITVNVENPFTDYTYPTYNYKYQVVSFKAGEQAMDGDRALKFVRSRHSGMNNEGSDFARSKRQQLVLAALKEKIFSAQTFMHPKKISEIVSTLHENIATNIQGWEFIAFARLAQQIDTQSIIRLNFDDSADGYLASSTIDGAYVLQPRSGSFAEMQDSVKTIFEQLEEQTKLGVPVSIDVRNGTKKAGLATLAASMLKKRGFAISAIGNAKGTAESEQTFIYDFTDGNKKEALDELVKIFNAPIVQTTSSETSNADILVILGKDARDLFAQ